MNNAKLALSQPRQGNVPCSDQCQSPAVDKPLNNESSNASPERPSQGKAGLGPSGPNSSSSAAQSTAPSKHQRRALCCCLGLQKLITTFLTDHTRPSVVTTQAINHRHTMQQAGTLLTSMEHALRDLQLAIPAQYRTLWLKHQIDGYTATLEALREFMRLQGLSGRVFDIGR
ncbi:hypothetical protein COCC4DRAFT_130556 [Bipolaris maydis ATCC 48331]|uniref:Aflatoxin regulatory protein domain-containing protein n=2 Tax=Cochliobolus heterostrophus TaxID=5016 RepID=M2UXF4_COCH5|nr:uncharacterized protein COCC4DRAFT_130556 [Bipolaris maydis ATCC 48331]EMD92472.1 hypothetical protein COCHEDRAFT_19176 [Bipolaris maydis C5]ENI08166.1 hypothetical protein COCC4DRAFT_130556 [Bipolaris maydis ATCC 48331]KAH7552897.1 hypothetical protein BM1_07870 [Bipolaris maydis]